MLFLLERTGTTIVFFPLRAYEYIPKVELAVWRLAV